MEKLANVTPAVQQKLEELTKTLESKLGKNLVGVVVHGSAVRGGWRAGASDVDIVVVLAEATQQALEAIGPALELARFSARIEAMLLTRDEIPRSADCFPLLYSDLARKSVTLSGTNPFKGLAVPDHHKRLRIEQELRELRIRMRRVATDYTGQANHYSGAVDRKLKQARDPLWSLMTLRGESIDSALPSGALRAPAEPGLAIDSALPSGALRAPAEPGLALDDTLEAVLAACAKAYSLDLSPLKRVREDAKAAFDTLGTLFDKALHDVDSREGGSA